MTPTYGRTMTEGRIISSCHPFILSACASRRVGLESSLVLRQRSVLILLTLLLALAAMITVVVAVGCLLPIVEPTPDVSAAASSPTTLEPPTPAVKVTQPSLKIEGSSPTATAALAAAAANRSSPALSLGRTESTSATQVIPVRRPGGLFVQAVAQDADTFNPVLTTDLTSQAVARKILPTLLGQDPHGGLITPTELAERWEISDAGRVYTFYLHTSISWSDGVPVTAADFKFTYAAIADAGVQSPLQASVDPIEQIETPDAHTLVIRLREADCAAFQVLRQPLLPSHLFAADFSDLHSNSFNMTPAVGAGPFLFVEHLPGEKISLRRNDAYWQGPPLLAGWIYGIVTDPAERLALLTAGEVDWMQLTPEQIEQTGTLTNVQVYTQSEDSISFIALNLANPANPQPGQDAAGALIAQDAHPILGDPRVRQAIALTVDTRQINQEVLANLAAPLASYVAPKVKWAAAAALPPYTPNLAQAAALLAAGGWQDDNNDGVRERAGVPLQLTLLTNNDSPSRLQMGELIRQQLAQSGFAVHFEPLDFETLTAALLGQTYDMAMIGWDNLSADPGNSNFWHSRNDLPGSGFNFTSYQNAEIDQLLDNAQRVPTCDPNVRAALYNLTQRRIYEDLPYIFLSSRQTAWAIANRWQGIQTDAWPVDFNVWTWAEKVNY